MVTFYTIFVRTFSYNKQFPSSPIIQKLCCFLAFTTQYARENIKTWIKAFRQNIFFYFKIMSMHNSFCRIVYQWIYFFNVSATSNLGNNKNNFKFQTFLKECFQIERMKLFNSVYRIWNKRYGKVPEWQNSACKSPFIWLKDAASPCLYFKRCLHVKFERRYYSIQ